MACAVPNASLPMRKTAVLPVRKTPAASANTFGRPSKTNATMPNGETTCSTFQPSCSTLLMTLPRVAAASRQARRPAIMSPRMRSSASNRVVERPRALARSMSARLAVSMCAQHAGVSRRCANRSKNWLMASSDTADNAVNAAAARSIATDAAC
ncbi:hypothetical protein D3C81_1427000 [compost metagenome]